MNKKNPSLLVGGFNPSEKYQSNWIISPNRDELKKCWRPPPSLSRSKDLNEILWYLLSFQKTQGFSHQTIRSTIGRDHHHERRTSKAFQDLQVVALYGGFHKWWYPKMDGVYWKTLLKWMIWG